MSDKRFLVEIEEKNRSACILDTETVQVYMLARFGRFEKTEMNIYIENLYDVCNLMNSLIDEKQRGEFWDERQMGNRD